jgi:hypothetical protein
MMRTMPKPTPARTPSAVSRAWIPLTLLGLASLLAAAPALGQVGREYRIELIIFAHNGPEARDYLDRFAQPVEPRLGRFGIGEGPIRPSLEEFGLETVAEQIERSGAGTVIERLVWEQVGRDFHRTPWIRIQAGRYLGLRDPDSADPVPHNRYSDPYSTPYADSYSAQDRQANAEMDADAELDAGHDTDAAWVSVSDPFTSDPFTSDPRTSANQGLNTRSGLALLRPEDERYELEGRLRVWVGRFLHLETDMVRYSVEAAMQSYDPPPGILVRGRQRMNSGEDLFYLDHPNVGIIARVTRIETDQ